MISREVVRQFQVSYNKHFQRRDGFAKLNECGWEDDKTKQAEEWAESFYRRQLHKQKGWENAPQAPVPGDGGAMSTSQTPQSPQAAEAICDPARPICEAKAPVCLAQAMEAEAAVGGGRDATYATAKNTVVKPAKSHVKHRDVEYSRNEDGKVAPPAANDDGFTIKKGDRGQPVGDAQTMLAYVIENAKLGRSGKDKDGIDEDYGPKTQQLVRQYLAFHHLSGSSGLNEEARVQLLRDFAEKWKASHKDVDKEISLEGGDTPLSHLKDDNVRNALQKARQELAAHKVTRTPPAVSEAPPAGKGSGRGPNLSPAC